MFTGLIEEVGQIKEAVKEGQGLRLNIMAKIVLEDLVRGDSVSTNGVCLTADRIHNQGFWAEVMPQTRAGTNLGTLRPGDYVNLERALLPTKRVGGHWVSGHVDGVAVLLGRRWQDKALWVEFEVPQELARYCIVRGSVALDGVSLTLADVQGRRIAVSLVGTTQKETTLRQKKIGDRINLECDMMAKQLEGLLLGKKEEIITMAFLEAHGFGG